MRKPIYNSVEELLDDSSFLMYCTGVEGADKEYWEKRIGRDATLQELALLAKQTYWSLQLRHPDNLRIEVENFRELRERNTTGKKTGSKITPLVRYWKQVSVAAAILISGVMVAVLLNHAPDTLVQTTQIGEIKEITLPDGSLMYLNGNTEVSYVEEGFENKRIVYLNRGEAFFEVQSGFESTFTVRTAKGLKVEDISTAFAVRSLKGLDQELVQVQEGLVRFLDPHEQQVQLLREGDAIRFDHETGRVIKSQADPLSVSGWIKGQYAAFDVTLDEFSKILSSVFDIEIQFRDAAAKNKRISILFNKEQEVDDILQNLQTIYGLKINVDGKKVQI